MKPVPIEKVYAILKREAVHYQVPVVDLIKMQTNDPFKVLITTMLSARTKDQTTLGAAQRLFAKVKNFADLVKLSSKELEQLIYPVGFYKTKAKHLKQLPLVMQEKFDNHIPQTIEELIQLPGVGRKTANLVVAVAFEKPGMCVDTHVHHIMNRLGYVKTKNPFQTEMALRKKLPILYWEKINSLLVAFGQHLCTPVSPKCSVCPIYRYCNRVGVKTSR
ncbi:TPA: endonuclease III [Candidatus Woesearchaeota archaeon]|nr:endonuclease III [Candidatus Woesearchaeota archaeon]HIH47773.1 endonuclease III [Candidatus Woesearchaeota archaeon]HII88426.1 endonuclease III [Candidatus Woesearchaeota archaeon]